MTNIAIEAMAHRNNEIVDLFLKIVIFQFAMFVYQRVSIFESSNGNQVKLNPYWHQLPIVGAFWQTLVSKSAMLEEIDSIVQHHPQNQFYTSFLKEDQSLTCYYNYYNWCFFSPPISCW
jgi:hypothetical protein